MISPETRMMGLPYGEEIMIVGRTLWTQCTSVTDRRTDRITITKTVQRRASHGKNITQAGRRCRSPLRFVWVVPPVEWIYLIDRPKFGEIWGIWVNQTSKTNVW